MPRSGGPQMCVCVCVRLLFVQTAPCGCNKLIIGMNASIKNNTYTHSLTSIFVQPFAHRFSFAFIRVVIQLLNYSPKRLRNHSLQLVQVLCQYIQKYSSQTMGETCENMCECIHVHSPQTIHRMQSIAMEITSKYFNQLFIRLFKVRH